MATSDGEASGDPPLGEPSKVQTGMVDLAAPAGAAKTPGAVWTLQSEDLNANLLVFPSGDGVAPHANSEVDVLLLGIAGAGIVEVDGVSHELRVGLVLVIPKGARRATRAVSDHLAYLTCHRRRAGLRPRRPPRPTAEGNGNAISEQ